MSTIYPGTVTSIVRSTDEYDKFHTMPGNRNVASARAKKIQKSIEENGWLHNPILVNDNLQIIDGQGRFEALRALGLPIEYMVIPNAGVRECVVFNSSQTKWTNRDYIESHAASGNQNYVRLLGMLKEFKELPESVVSFVCNNMKDTSSIIVTSGRFEFAAENEIVCREMLQYLTKFNLPADLISGPRPVLLKAVAFAYGLPDTNRDQLLRKCQMNISRAIPFNDIRTALKCIERMYNYRMSTPVYFENEYDRYLRGTYSWYAKKWGDRYTNKKPSGVTSTGEPAKG